MARTILTPTGVKWTTPRPVEHIYLTDTEYAATSPANATALAEDHPQYAVGNRWDVERPLAKRRVRIMGNGVAGSGKSVRKIKGITVDAADAARLAGLNAEETALFVSRFPEDGTLAGPAKNAETAEAIRTVFLKVLDLPKRVATIDLSDAGNVELE